MRLARDIRQTEIAAEVGCSAVSMKANTALSFALSGTALLRLTPHTAALRTRGERG